MSLPSINFLERIVYEKLPRTRFSNSRSLWQGQIKVTPGYCTPKHLDQSPYQVSTSYTLRFLRHNPDKIFKLKVTAVRANQGRTMMLHTYIPQPISLPSINFLHIMVSEIQPGQTFSCCLPTHPDAMGENNTCSAL